MHLLPVIDQIAALNFHLSAVESVRQDLTGISLLGLSQLSISVFLLLVSVGLWLHLRLAWLLTLVAAVITLINMVSSEDSLESWLFVYDIVLLGLLLANYRHFERSSMRIGTFIALVAVVLLFGYSILGVYHLGDQFSPNIDTLSDAFYLTVITMSSVGYGDIIPTSAESRLLMVSIIILSIVLFSTAIGATLIPAMVRKMEKITGRREEKVKRNNHYIIVGESALSNNTYRELVTRGEQVTVILPQESSDVMFGAADVDVVIGDGSDLETLHKADAEKARAILALMDDDSENAFVILAVKELKISAKTVAAVNQAKHLNRIRRVNPDMIIAPQVLGGELLTSMLVGERIDIKDIMGHLLGHADPQADADNSDHDKTDTD
jgi:voltage-gated potassium channel